MTRHLLVIGAQRCGTTYLHDLLAAHPDIARTLVTHEFPLEDAPEAFRVAADRAAGALKVVLHP